MIKITKKIFTLFSLAILLSLGTNPAHAWYMELTNVVGDIEVGSYYAQQINFHSDTGTDNLNDFGISVDYDETKVELYGIAHVDYDNGNPMFPETVWDGGIFPHSDTGDVVYNITGSETFGYLDDFFPPAGDNLMATIYWTPLVTETNVIVSLWTDGPVTDLTTVGNNKYYPSAELDKDNYRFEYRDLTANTDNFAPVPIPGAVWLLGSGLLGLIGIKRKNA